MKILSVDDSNIIRRIIRSVVNVLGHEFLEAAEGEEALAILEAENGQVDLVLLDWNMPGLSGYELLLTLKNDARFKHIPVMMVTTESEKSNIIQAVKAGAINYITKPFTSEDLIVKIMECTGGEH